MKSKWWIIGVAAALALAILAPFASSFPDGLEKAVQDHGFIDRAALPFFTLAPDYVFPGIHNDTAATIAAGILGTLILFGLGLGLAALLRNKHEA